MSCLRLLADPVVSALVTFEKHPPASNGRIPNGIYESWRLTHVEIHKETLDQQRLANSFPRDSHPECSLKLTFKYSEELARPRYKVPGVGPPTLSQLLAVSLFRC